MSSHAPNVMLLNIELTVPPSVYESFSPSDLTRIYRAAKSAALEAASNEMNAIVEEESE